MAPQTAAIYARISSEPDGTRMAITRQIEDCRAFAQRRRWHVIVTRDPSRPITPRSLGRLDDAR